MIDDMVVFSKVSNPTISFRKCLEMFAEIAEKKDDYNTLYDQFGDDENNNDENKKLEELKAELKPLTK